MAKTHKHRLREIAKFASGLVLADFMCAWWFAASGLLPMKVWGIQMTAEIAYLGMAFDLLLFALLVHYAWHPSILEPTVSKRRFFMLVGIVTAIVGLAHLARLALGVDVAIGSFQFPIWLSWVGAILTIYISYASFHFIRK